MESKVPASLDDSQSSLPSVQALGAMDRDAVLAHLLDLNAADRRLRFGNPVSDDLIEAYVNALAFETDDVFGVYDTDCGVLRLFGMAHVAYGNADAVQNGLASGEAEIGLSVLEAARGRGIGAALFARTTERAKIRFVTKLRLHYLVENTAMQHMARRAGMEVHSAAGETDAYLVLRRPDPVSHPLLGESAAKPIEVPPLSESTPPSTARQPNVGVLLRKPAGKGVAKIRALRRGDHGRAANGRRVVTRVGV